MGKIDLKDSYFLVPIHSKSRKILKISISKSTVRMYLPTIWFVHCPLCFFKNISTHRKSFKIIRINFIHPLGTLGLIPVIYLDDMLLFAKNKEECSSNINYTIQLFTSLGFLINKEKSIFVPT